MKRILKWSAVVILLGLIVLGLVAYWTSTNDCGRNATVPSHPMKAIRYCEYGSPDVLRLEDVEKPTPAGDELLVKVHAVSINPLDWHFLRGTPLIGRLEFGLRKPKSTRLGVDFSGTVEAVGAKVTQFKAGDEVFGGKDGAFAEYLCVRAEKAVALKPQGVTFEQAAAVPIAGITALQALRDRGRVQPGQTVLVNGASGGVGTFAVQIAKSLGAKVTGVCSSRNAETVRSLGAEEVIDYTREDFTKGEQRYDLILDNVVNHSLTECRRALKPNGKYIMIGGGGVNDQSFLGPFGRALAAPIMSWFGSQKLGMMLAQMNKEGLNALSDLMQTGKVKSVIDRTYPLNDLAAAMRYLEEGHARGKVVIKVD